MRSRWCSTCVKVLGMDWRVYLVSQHILADVDPEGEYHDLAQPSFTGSVSVPCLTCSTSKQQCSMEIDSVSLIHRLRVCLQHDEPFFYYLFLVLSLSLCGYVFHKRRQQQKSWMSSPDCRGCAGQAADAVSVFSGRNGGCCQIIENSQIVMCRHFDSSTKTQMA